MYAITAGHVVNALEQVSCPVFKDLVRIQGAIVDEVRELEMKIGNRPSRQGRSFFDTETMDGLDAPLTVAGFAVHLCPSNHIHSLSFQSTRQ